MPLPEVSIVDESVRLGQFLKLSGLAEGGSDAKLLVESGEVTVNGRVELRRGRQLRDGDVVALEGRSFRLRANAAGDPR